MRVSKYKSYKSDPVLDLMELTVFILVNGVKSKNSHEQKK